MGKTENGVKPGVLNGLLFGRAVPEPVLAALLYLAFCFAYWPGTGASLAAAVVTYSSLEAMTSILGNELVAFLMAGILPFVATELLANVSIRSAMTLGADGALLKRLFRFFYGAGLLTSGLVGLLCFAFPFLVLLYSSVARFVILTAFTGLYLAFVCKRCFPPYLAGRAVFYLGRVYLLANLLLCFAEILTTVI